MISYYGLNHNAMLHTLQPTFMGINEMYSELINIPIMETFEQTTFKQDDSTLDLKTNLN